MVICVYLMEHLSIITNAYLKNDDNKIYITVQNFQAYLMIVLSKY